ncbi:MAG: 4'-phosphopantetheinyl transferase superfamily protein [Taibaiella sp.]|jgi:phosphopantetheinyl transferase (holo-ACP synthase)
MIGNDIIDLSQARAESDWQRKGWINKIFTQKEQELITASAAKELIVWLMWSMKEAAYKIYHREFKEMFYAPQKFICSDISIADNLATGRVHFDQSVYNTSSHISSAFIHTVAIIQNNLDNTIVYIQDKTKATPKHQVPYNLFKDEHGIPYSKDHHNGSVKNASKSHHGRFEAIVIAKN